MQHFLKKYEKISDFSTKIEVNKFLFTKIKFPNGKTDLAGVIIFSEILACFQNSEQLSRTKTGNFLLDKSYTDFSKEFGLTKRQVSDAILRLESLGFIRRSILTIYKNKKAYPNSVFIELTAPSHEFSNLELPQEIKKGRAGATINPQRANFFYDNLTFKRDIPLERGPYRYINTNSNKNINKQTNSRVSFFDKKVFKISETSIKPTLIEDLDILPAEWETWAQEELLWDDKTRHSEFTRFFNYHKKAMKPFVNWFEAWKGWCKMSFNVKKAAKSPEKTGPDTNYHSNQSDAFDVQSSNPENTQPNNDPISQEIKEKLLAFGLSHSRADVVVKTMEPSRILKNLSYVTLKIEEGFEIKNKAGYLWKALWEDYAKEYEEIKGEAIQIEKPPLMLRQEEESLMRDIEERPGSELNKKIHKTFLKTFGLTPYKSWFKEVNFTLNSEKTITLKCPSNFYRDWLSTHKRSGIEFLLRSVFSEGMQVQFVT